MSVESRALLNTAYVPTDLLPTIAILRNFCDAGMVSVGPV